MTELARPDRAAEGQLLVESSHADGTVVLTVYGVIDIESAAEFERELRRAEASREQVILDLDGLSFMDSSALQVLVRATNRAAQRGRVVRLRRVPGHAQRLLDITGLSSRFPIADDPGRPPADGTPREGDVPSAGTEREGAGET